MNEFERLIQNIEYYRRLWQEEYDNRSNPKHRSSMTKRDVAKFDALKKKIERLQSQFQSVKNEFESIVY